MNTFIVEPPVFAFDEGSYEVNEAVGTVRIGVVKQFGDIISGSGDIIIEDSVTIDVKPRQGSGQIRGAGVYCVCVCVCVCVYVSALVCVRMC